MFAADGAATVDEIDPIAHAGDDAAEAGRLTAPMPGKVIAFLAQAGDTVDAGQPLAVMEAMKMEHTIASPRDGTVAELLYAVGRSGRRRRRAAAARGRVVIRFQPTRSAMLPAHVTLVEVGPRDGLQNEKQPVSTAQKVELVHRLQAAGLREIEVTSFVSPKWVPQMADNAAVMAAIERQPGVRYSVLTPNLKGFEAALGSRPDEIVVFAAASEAFSQRNINCSIAESHRALRAGRRGGACRTASRCAAAVSVALGCPYQGEVDARRGRARRAR